MFNRLFIIISHIRIVHKKKKTTVHKKLPSNMPINRSAVRLGATTSHFLRQAFPERLAGYSFRGYSSSAIRWAGSFNWEDPLVASELYTGEELAVQDTARRYCQERLLPRVLGTLHDT